MVKYTAGHKNKYNQLKSKENGEKIYLNDSNNEEYNSESEEDNHIPNKRKKSKKNSKNITKNKQLQKTKTKNKSEIDLELQKRILLMHSENKTRNSVNLKSDFRKNVEYKVTINRENQTIFECTQCNSDFKEKGHLKTHFISVHRKKSAFECYDCAKSFCNNRVLRRHIMFMHNVDIYDVIPSNVGKRKIPGSKKVNGQQNKTIKRENINGDGGLDKEKINEGVHQKKPSINDYTFNFIEGEQYTLEKDDQGKKLYVCKRCQKSFTNKVHCKLHCLKYEDIKPFECETCGKKFKRVDKFKTHLKTHGSEKDIERLKCSICHRVFSSPASAQGCENTHMQIFIEECPYCDKKFTRPNSLKPHLRSAHVVDKTTCTVCNVVCRNKATYRIHWAKCHRQRSLKCPECDKIFNTYSRYQSHIMSHNKKHLCYLCGKTLNTRHGLREHLMRHYSQKPFECDQCERKFVVKRKLVDHKKTHEGPPIKCDHCHKVFKSQKTLVSHEKFHTQKVFHPCKFCQNSFMSKHSLKTHEKAEHGTPLSSLIRKSRDLD